MKKHLIQWLIVSLALSGTANAQVVASRPPEIIPLKTVVCGDLGMREIRITSEKWNAMSADEQARTCALGQPQPNTIPMAPTMTYQEASWHRLSPKLMMAGGVVALAGSILVIPNGENYRILDSQYCVTTYAVDYGRCESQWPKGGWILLGIGGAMAFVGAVRISPTVTQHTVGATATLHWGK